MTSMRLRRATAAVGVFAVAATLYGCTEVSNPGSGGSLQMGGADNFVEVCGPDSSPTHRLIWGDNMRVAGPFPVRILDVSLVGADNLVIDEASVAVPQVTNEFGLSDDPPTDFPDMMPLWLSRVPAVAAVVAPPRDHNLLLVVHRPDRSRPGHAERIVVTYAADGHLEAQQNSESLTVVSSACR